MFTEALVRTLTGGEADVEVEVAACAVDAARLCKGLRPVHLVLVEMRLPDAANLEYLSRVVAAVSPTPVGVVSEVPDDRFAESCRARGAVRVIEKAADADTIGRAVRSLLAGKSFRRAAGAAIKRTDPWKHVRSLSRQQARVLVFLCQGLPNKEIAHEMGIKEATVKSHLSGLFKRLRVKSRTQAVLHLHNCDWTRIERGSRPASGRPPVLERELSSRTRA